MSEEIKARMQRIGKAIESELPEGYGFFALCFRMSEPDEHAQYVSNANRPDVVEAMKDFIARNPMQEIGRN